MFVLRTNGKISSGFGCAQFAGQEEVPDDDPQVITYLQALANPAPSQATPLQMRRALRKLGLLDQVNAYVQSQSVDVQDSWQYCIGFPRNDPMIVAAATALNVDLDALFALAATFP
jgi:hypothetical protein